VTEPGSVCSRRYRHALTRLLSDAIAASSLASDLTLLAAAPVRIFVRTSSVELATNLVRDAGPHLTPQPFGGIVDIRSADVVQIAVEANLARRLAAVVKQDHPRNGHPLPYQTAGPFRVAHKVTGASDRRADAFVIWAEDAPNITSVVLSGTGAAASRLLLRTVRAIAARTLLREGWTPLHAACAVTPEGAICLVGGHGSGKTTALLQLLESGRGTVGYLANNAVFLMPAPTNVHARGLPTAAAIRMPTLRMFPALMAFAKENQMLWGVAAGQANERHADRRPTVTAHQLGEVFSVPLTPQAPLAAVVAVTYDPRARGLGWQSRSRPVTGWRAHQLCRSACVGQWLADDRYELARLSADCRKLGRLHNSVLDRVARTVPCAGFRIAPGADVGSDLCQLLAFLNRDD
jgi:hypothetical protein